MLSQYACVRLVSDAYAHEGALRGLVGYVIEVYGGGHYEVEFSDPATGCPVAQVVIAQEDLVETPATNGP